MTRSFLLVAALCAAPAFAQSPVNLVPADRDLAWAPFRVAVSADSQRVAFGVPGEKSQQGAVYVFDRTAQGWVQTARVAAEDSSADRSFGKSLALDGNTLVVTSNGVRDASFNARGGELYRFEFVPGPDGDVWDQRQKVSVGFGFEAGFGGNVVNGSIDAVDVIDGARFAFRGARGSGRWVSVHEPSAAAQDPWAESARIDSPPDRVEFGSDVALGGDRLVIGASVYETNGGVYVYRLIDETWMLTSTLTAGSAGASQEGRLAGALPQFGRSVAISGDRIAVGAPFVFDNDANRLTGAAYVFDATVTGGAETWALTTRLLPDDDLAGNAQFGIAVAIEGDRIVVGAQRDNGADGQAQAGAAYVFDGTASGWTQAAKLDLPSGVDGNFGADVAVSDGQPVVTAQNDVSAWVFAVGDPVASEGAPEADLRLSAPAPNPASGRATLALTLDVPQRVRAVLVDALGREVRTLLDAGVGSEAALSVETAGLAPGLYVVRVSGERFVAARALTVVR